MNRWQLGSWLLAGLCVCGSAAAAEKLPAGMRACMSESDATRRLACFDRESARLTQESAPVARNPDPPATAVPAAAATTAKSTPAPTAAASSGEDKFGYRGTIARAELDKKEEEDKQFEQLTAKVTDVARQPRGELILTLDNGQIWQQKPGDHAMKVKAGDEVTIRRASLGSFLLTSEAVKGSMRVTRIK
jgi:hypothetical protein